MTGPGDPSIAQDLYRTAIFGEVALMWCKEVYVSMDNLMSRMPSYNQEILWIALWGLMLEGKLS